MVMDRESAATPVVNTSRPGLAATDGLTPARLLKSASVSARHAWPWAPSRPPALLGTFLAAERIDRLNFLASSLEHSTSVMEWMSALMMASRAAFRVAMADAGAVVLFC